MTPAARSPAGSRDLAAAAGPTAQSSGWIWLSMAMADDPLTDDSCVGCHASTAIGSRFSWRGDPVTGVPGCRAGAAARPGPSGGCGVGWGRGGAGSRRSFGAAARRAPTTGRQGGPELRGRPPRRNGRRPAGPPGRPRPAGRTAGCCGRAGPRLARRSSTGRDGSSTTSARPRWASGSGTSPRAARRPGSVSGVFRATARAGSAAVRSAVERALGLRGDPGQERGRLAGVAGPLGVGEPRRPAPELPLERWPRRPAGPGT